MLLRQEIPTTAAPSKREELISDFRQQAPLLFAICLFLFLFSTLYWRACAQTGGRYIYPLDDAYIGMAVAKSMALHGVWGINGNGFASVISTPAFVFLLGAFYWITGVNEWWPLVLNVISSILAIVFADRFFFRKLSLVWRAIGLVALILLVPLPVLALIGMEHPTHIAFAIAFLGLAMDRLMRPQQSARLLVVLAPFLVLVRYESLALVVLCAGAFILRRRFWIAGAIAGSAALGVISYGIISMVHGWGILPASVALKGAVASVPTTLLLKPIAQIVYNRYTWGIVAALLLCITTASGIERLVAGVIAGATLLHFQFGQLGWSYRYEAYLVALAVIAACFCFGKVPRLKWMTAALGASAVLLGTRAVSAFAAPPEQSASIAMQQYQMARFVKQYYDGASIALNDIGTIGFFTEARCIDLVGLGTREIYRAKTANAYRTEVIRSQTSQAKIAIVYDGWFGENWKQMGVGMGGPPLPSEWVRVGEWIAPTWVKSHVGSDVVTFYAVDRTEAPQLTKHLQSYSPELPAFVRTQFM